jgi:predicted RNA-binding protein with PIN domain
LEILKYFEGLKSIIQEIWKIEQANEKIEKLKIIKGCNNHNISVTVSTTLRISSPELIATIISFQTDIERSSSKIQLNKRK